MKIIIAIISIFAFIYLLFISIGFISSSIYKGEVTKEYNISVENLWEIVYNVENFGSWRQDIIGISILESDGEKPTFWLEYTDDGGAYANESLEVIPRERFTVRIKSKTYGIEGIRTYILSSTYNGCNLTIQEEITIDEIILRSILFFRGREYYINQQLSWLDEAI